MTNYFRPNVNTNHVTADISEAFLLFLLLARYVPNVAERSV